MIIESREPVYGNNYRMGYIGGTFRSDVALSYGIAWFTRFHRMTAIPISHVLMVTGPDECIEAQAGQGVIVSSLCERFSDPRCIVSFRSPLNWTPRIGLRLVSEMCALVGSPDDDGLIRAHALSGTLLGRWADHLTHGYTSERLAVLLGDPRAWMCSESCAHALDRLPEYHDRGVLAKPDAVISPQELFGDESGELFDPWKDGV